MAITESTSVASTADGRDAQLDASNLPVVVHSVHTFLHVSENWIHPQVVALTRYRSHVLAQRSENTGQFPLPDTGIYLPSRCRKFVDRLWRRLRLGHYAPPDRRNRRFDLCRPQVLHSHFGNVGYTDIPLARKLRIPHVVTFYGWDVSRLPRQKLWPERFAHLFRKATLFTVEGPHMKASLAALGCPERKIRIRRIGVDLRQFPFVPRRMGEDGAVKILIAARFTEKKGIPDAVRAVAQIAGEFPFVRLTVIGDGHGRTRHAQELKQQILDLLHEPPLRSRSEWLGSVPFAEFRRIALEHHIFIQASTHAKNGDCEGGAPVALIQVAATGMPVVATRHCDIPEVVRDGETGYLSPERDVASLAACLRRLVCTPEMWPRLGHAARRHVANTFELSRTIGELEAVYDEARELYRISGKSAVAHGIPVCS